MSQAPSSGDGLHGSAAGGRGRPVRCADGELVGAEIITNFVARRKNDTAGLSFAKAYRHLFRCDAYRHSRSPFSRGAPVSLL